MEEVFKKLLNNESGTLSPLEDLNYCGKRFLYVLIHLLLKEGILQLKISIHKYSTFLFLKSNKNINVDQNEVISTLSNFIEIEL